jgi:hypothetical protein
MYESFHSLTHSLSLPPLYIYIYIYRERERERERENGHDRNMRQDNYVQSSKEMAWKTDLVGDDTDIKAWNRTKQKEK